MEYATKAKMPLPHWEDADGPTEDMFLHAQDFKGLSWDSFLSTPRYAEWLIDEADMTSAYEYQKLVLQILQSKAPGTWNLKMPSHSVHIDTLLKVFPDARIIWAHRDPYKATGSLCNLWKLPKEVVAGQTDIDYIAMGANAAKQMKAHVERPLRARERIGDDRFFHMYYHDMMRDPMAVMRNIYDWAGDELTAGGGDGDEAVASRASAGPLRAQQLHPRPIRAQCRDARTDLRRIPRHLRHRTRGRRMSVLQPTDLYHVGLIVDDIDAAAKRLTAVNGYQVDQTGRVHPGGHHRRRRLRGAVQVHLLAASPASGTGTTGSGHHLDRLPTPRRTTSATGLTTSPPPPPRLKTPGIAKRPDQPVTNCRCSPTTPTPPACASRSSTAHCSPTGPAFWK